MSEDSSLNVAAVLTIPPLDQGSVVAGHRGLSREVHWVDIIHAPAEDFVRPGDLVLTTGADIHQPGVRDFLVSLVSSPAAGIVLSPPPDVDAHDLLELLIPLADKHGCPFVLLPWEIAFADVQKTLLPLVSPSPPDTRVQMVIGRRVRDNFLWSEAADRFAKALHELALAAGLTVTSSVTDDLVMSHFSSAPTESTVSGLVDSARRLSRLPDDLVAWALLAPAHGHAVAVAAPVSQALPESPAGPMQFAEVLRQHPRSMATILQTLQPLVDYDKTRRGQLVHTLEILLDEATNTSAAARALFLNRHSLLYRIKLIEELTGLSLKNPADRFQLEVSVRVHQINEAR
ncbi:PucR family transcriptional regulator [Mycolicibacterium setense]|uniref:PucR family transcriptional regulator n=1 Tax=Mycolicibacterium setense TaxID=431269 RepID=UPI000573A04D|nr:PucR family transcriptional regulator ligand-binding domain-containing protein [Mycolicibacterium setense]KHO23221.1 polyketide synthase regulator [Mycolicibacterium setense]MCV7115243.1 PucR family transcriptional regulator ligand-binding domain-containing protein [Mycolicibacterium setense]